MARFLDAAISDIVEPAPAATAIVAGADPNPAKPTWARDLGLQTAMPADARIVSADVPMSIDLISLLLWAAVICGTAAILWGLRDSLPAGMLSSRLRRWRGPADAAEATRSRRHDAARLAADELAGEGRFAEAMHVLLLDALGDMRRRRDDLAFADSLTSREIVRRAPVDEDAKSALGGLIGLVERSWFGDHRADAVDYDAARARYLALGTALQTRPA